MGFRRLTYGPRRESKLRGRSGLTPSLYNRTIPVTTKGPGGQNAKLARHHPASLQPWLTGGPESGMDERAIAAGTSSHPWAVVALGMRRDEAQMIPPPPPPPGPPRYPSAPANPQRGRGSAVFGAYPRPLTLTVWSVCMCSPGSALIPLPSVLIAQFGGPNIRVAHGPGSMIERVERGRGALKEGLPSATRLNAGSQRPPMGLSSHCTVRWRRFAYWTLVILAHPAVGPPDRRWTQAKDTTGATLHRSTTGWHLRALAPCS